MSRTTRHQASACPSCGYVMDASTAVTDPNAVPKPGDLTICIKCGTPLQYGPGLMLQKLSAETWENLDPATTRMLQRAAQMIQDRKDPGR